MFIIDKAFWFIVNLIRQNRILYWDTLTMSHSWLMIIVTNVLLWTTNDRAIFLTIVIMLNSLGLFWKNKHLCGWFAFNPNYFEYNFLSFLNPLHLLANKILWLNINNQFNSKVSNCLNSIYGGFLYMLTCILL